MKIYEVKTVGAIELAADRASRVLHPNQDTTLYTVYEIDGKRYVQISGNTHGREEFTALDDLVVDQFDGLLKAAHAPLVIDRSQLAGYDKISPSTLPRLTTDNL